MTKKMLIDATHAEETRVVVLDGNKVDEFDFESLNKRQLAGNIYLAKVTRVEPSLQAAFVEYGGNRHGFLAFSEVHPDYYQIPKADRDALIAETEAYEKQIEDDEAAAEQAKSRSRSRNRRRSKALEEGTPSSQDEILVSEPVTDSEAEAPTSDPEDATAEPVADSTEISGADSSDNAAPATEDNAPSDADPVTSDETGAEPAATDAETPEVLSDGKPEDTAETVTQPDEAEVATNSDVIDLAPDADDQESTLVSTPENQSSSQDDSSDAEPVVERPVRKPRPKRYKIQEVVKVRQILLVQVVKEERGNKGAALTTYLSLAGRYCVLMPNTSRGGGISRKITNASDRKKLKEISSSIVVPQGAGLIIRTAGSNRTKTEIRRDYEYLLRQWEQIRDMTMKSIAPCLIYEEGSLVRRAIRDLYSRDIDEVLVDGERGYNEASEYMKMLMPTHARNVKHYSEPLPLFSRFQIESFLSGMFNPVVQLKSGGYIVIDVTEALVAIDVNSGRATRESSIEDTALRTNLEAAEEAARQMRLRDLAGLIVIDFIDMEERKNNSAVEKKIKDKLKSDRARIQVGRISGFGLLEMSRQRLRPGMIEATTKGCPHCHGTGLVRSDDSIALSLLREIEEEGVRQRSKEVLITAPVEVANYLLNQKREHIAMIESRFGLSVRVEGKASLVSPDFEIERLKTASRIVPRIESVELPAPPVDDVDEAITSQPEATDQASPEAADADSSDKPRKKRRRRRRGGKSNDNSVETPEADTSAAPDEPTEEAATETQKDQPETTETAEKPASRRRRSRGNRSKNRTVATDSDEIKAEASEEPTPDVVDTPADETSTVSEAGSADTGIVEVPESDAPQKPRRQRVRQPAASVIATADNADGETLSVEAEIPVVTEVAPESAGAKSDDVAEASPEPLPAGETETIAEPAPVADEEVMVTTAAEPAPKKRRGWWSRAFED